MGRDATLGELDLKILHRGCRRTECRCIERASDDPQENIDQFEEHANELRERFREKVG